MASVDAPKVPTAGEQLNSSVDAYLQNEDALRRAARTDTLQAFELSRLGLLGDQGTGGNNYADIIRDMAPLMDEVTQGSNSRLRESDLRDVMGNAYDPNKSMAENLSSVDAQANPELYSQIQQLTGIQTPDLTTPNWADQNAYGLANRNQLATSAWNRFDQNADAMRNRAMPQLNNIDNPTWAAREIYKDNWDNANRYENEIFNYSPEANRAREILGARLSDGGGENLAYAYGHAQNLNKRETGAGTETGMRDNLLSNLGMAGRNIGANNVGLQIDNEGLMSDRQRAALQEDSRAAFQARGRVRDDAAIMGEMADLDRFRAMRRQENNQNFMNQANVGLANAQNQLQARIASGQQGLQGLGMQGNIINDRFANRMAADDSYNRRMMESINAMAGTDAQRFGNFQAGMNANMGFDADYQNRVQRGIAENQREQDNLWRIEQDWQNRQAFGNQAALQQDALAAQRLAEYTGASDNWNQRLAVDDTAARARMADLLGISSNWNQREQQNFGNQLQKGLASIGAYQGVRQDPWSSLTGRNSANVNTNMGAWAQGNPQAQAGNVGFSGVWDLNNSLTNMDINAQNQANAANAQITAGMMQGVGSAIGGFCWWARAVYGEDNPKWLIFREWLLSRAPKWFVKLYAWSGPRYAHRIGKLPVVKAILKPFMDMAVNSMLERKVAHV